MKYVTVALIVIVSQSLSTAQCVPDSVFSNSSVPGFFPSPLQGNLPEAVNGNAYELTLSLKVPQDTSIDLSQFGLSGTQSIGVNSMKINEVSGLPEGLEFIDCNNSSCKWATNEVGCFKIMGEPTEVGDFELGVNITMNVDVPFIGATDLPAFDLVTYELAVTVASGVLEANSKNDNALRIFPNPTNDIVNLDCKLKTAGDVKITIFNSLGKQVYNSSKNLDSGNSQIQINLEDQTQGFYILRFNSNEETIESRFILN
ncbi:MAG: T9SS type A sorting domain-containing protein [Bacteroidia bacterium]